MSICIQRELRIAMKREVKKMIHENVYSSRACPVCNSHDGQRLFHQDFGENEIIPITDYYVTHCNNCGMIFSDGIPTQDEINQYYSNRSRYDHSHRDGKQSDSDIKRLNSLAEFIMLHVPKDARILDVGCSTADLLAILKSKGYSNLEGMDPSPASAEFAMKRHGIHVINSVMEPNEKKYEQYDIIILSNVLEHIIDHSIFMNRVLTWLKIDGFIVTEVPDASRFHKSRNSPYQEFSVEHVNFFTPNSLKTIF